MAKPRIIATTLAPAPRCPCGGPHQLRLRTDGASEERLDGGWRTIVETPAAVIARWRAAGWEVVG